MQSYEDDKLIKTQTGEIKKLAEDITKAAVNVHHVIGHLPNKGDSITLNGLSYKIVSVNKAKGHFVAHIRKPKKMK